MIILLKRHVHPSLMTSSVTLQAACVFAVMAMFTSCFWGVGVVEQKFYHFEKKKKSALNRLFTFVITVAMHIGDVLC